jgi:RNA polymerase sigma-70 factor (ECF subfamily)
MNNYSDEQLVALSLKDSNYFRFLVERHQRPLLLFIFRNYVKDYDQASDIVQESFIKAYFKIKSYDSSKKWKTWLYKIAINCVKSSFTKPENINIDDCNLPSSYSVERVLEKEILNKKLNEAFQSLAPHHATILQLFYLKEYSHKDISLKLKIPLYSVKSRIGYAERLLKQFYIVGN